MKNKKSIAILIYLIFALFLLAGCNSVQGQGYEVIYNTGASTVKRTPRLPEEFDIVYYKEIIPELTEEHVVPTLSFVNDNWSCTVQGILTEDGDLHYLSVRFTEDDEFLKYVGKEILIGYTPVANLNEELIYYGNTDLEETTINDIKITAILATDGKTMNQGTKLIYFVANGFGIMINGDNLTYEEMGELLAFYMDNSVDLSYETLGISTGYTIKLDPAKIHTLENLGYSKSEINEMTDEQIAEIFAPGTQLDGAPLLLPDEEEISELSNVGISYDDAIVLGNLGYTYEEILAMTQEEIDFIFPTTELISKLVSQGYIESEIDRHFVLIDSGYDNYKQLIREAMAKGG